jgi:hypothetical protein
LTNFGGGSLKNRIEIEGLPKSRNHPKHSLLLLHLEIRLLRRFF